MKKDFIFGEQEQVPFNNALEHVLRKEARELLQQVIEAGVATKNRKLPKKLIQTGIGQILVEQPQIRNKREETRFVSKIIPPYAKRAPIIEEVVPTLYLKGISTKHFQEALESLLGENTKKLSATKSYA